MVMRKLTLRKGGKTLRLRKNSNMRTRNTYLARGKTSKKKRA